MSKVDLGFEGTSVIPTLIPPFALSVPGDFVARKLASDASSQALSLASLIAGHTADLGVLPLQFTDHE